MITRKNLINFLSDNIKDYLPSDINTHYADEASYEAKEYDCIVTIKALSGDIQTGVMNYPINLYVEVNELFFDDVLAGMYMFVEDFCDNKKHYTYTDPIEKTTTSVYFNASTPYVPQTKIKIGTIKRDQIIVQMQLSTVDETLVIFDDSKMVKFTNLEYLSYAVNDKFVNVAMHPNYENDGKTYTELTNDFICDNLLTANLQITHSYNSFQKKDNPIPDNKLQSITGTLRFDFTFDKSNIVHCDLYYNAFSKKDYTIDYDNGSGMIYKLNAKLVELNSIGQRGSAESMSAQFIVTGVETKWQ